MEQCTLAWISVCMLAPARHLSRQSAHPDSDLREPHGWRTGDSYELSPDLHNHAAACRRACVSTHTHNFSDASLNLFPDDLSIYFPCVRLTGQVWSPSGCRSFRNYTRDQVWWCMPIIPVLGRQKQTNLCKLKSSMVYIASSGLARAM